MSELVTINVFGEIYSGIIENDEMFNGGKKIIIETTGGTMCLAIESFKKDIQKPKK
jgi:hypothetical protein